MTPDKLLRRALAEGAEVEINGRLVNAARQRIRAVKRDPTPPAPVAVKPEPPAPPALPALTREEVQAMLAAQEARWKAALDELRAEVRAPRPAPKPTKKVIKFTYDGNLIKGAEVVNKE